jgi:hypothetical protein
MNQISSWSASAGQVIAGVPASQAMRGTLCSAQLSLTSTGAASTAWTLYGANSQSPAKWEQLGSFSASSGAGAPGSDAATFMCAFPFLKAVCDVITGTGAVAEFSVSRG